MALVDYESLRPAGLLEKYSTTRHALGLYNNVACTAIYSSRDGPRTSVESCVLGAMRRMIDLHPALSALPIDEAKTIASFVRLPQIDLRKSVDFLTRSAAFFDAGEGLDDMLESQHHRDFKTDYGTLPFWRLVIVKDEENASRFAACFVYAHCLGDGLSGLAFHRTFRRALADAYEDDPHAEDAALPIVKSPAKPMLASLEESHPLPLTLWHTLRTIWSEIFSKPSKVLLVGRPIDLNPVRRILHVRTLTIEPDRVATLLGLSRKEGTTLQGLFDASVAAAIFENVAEEACQTLVASSPLSLRRFLPDNVAHEDNIGVFVSSYTHTIKRPMKQDQGSKQANLSSLWQDARNARNVVEQELKNGGTNTAVALLRWAGDLKLFFQGKAGKRRTVSLECSNLGQFKCEDNDKGSWRIGKILFSQDNSPTGALIATSFVTDPSGCLNIAFSWLDDAIDVTTVLGIIRSFENLLRQLTA